MQIEVSNRCALRCRYCPHPDQRRSKGDMTEEMFLKCLTLVHHSVNPCVDGRKFVWLNHFGEPLLHPQLAHFIARAIGDGIDVSFATSGVAENGRRVSRDEFERLATLGVKGLVLSAHQHNLEELTRRTEGLFRWRHFWTPQASHLHDWAGQVDVGLACGRETRPEPCDYATHDMFAVTWDGRVAACCYDIEAGTGRSVDDVLAGGFQFRPIELCNHCSLGRGDAAWLLDPAKGPAG